MLRKPLVRVAAVMLLVTAAQPAWADDPGWVSFCGTLQDIRALSETPPTAPDPTHGRQGLVRLARLYGELLGESPNRRVERLLREVRPVLGHGVTTIRPLQSNVCSYRMVAFTSP